MARKACRPEAQAEYLLTPQRSCCAVCGHLMRIAYRTRRIITTLQELCRLTLRVRWCRNQACPHHRRPYRPEEEGRWALPHGEFGLDVIALVGTLRYTAHRSIPEIHQTLLVNKAKSDQSARSMSSLAIDCLRSRSPSYLFSNVL